MKKIIWYHRDFNSKATATKFYNKILGLKKVVELHDIRHQKDAKCNYRVWYCKGFILDTIISSDNMSKYPSESDITELNEYLKH